MCTVKTNTEILLDSGKEFSFQVKSEKTKCLFIYLEQTAGQHHNIKMGNKCGKFKCLGIALTNISCMNEDIKSRLNLGFVATI
jgi:hypothetical protein